MTTPAVVGIDPGKSGFECILSSCDHCEKGVPKVGALHVDVKHVQSAPYQSVPCVSSIFYPSPLTTKLDKDGNPIHDPDGDYDLSAMVNLCVMWRNKSVRLVVLERQAPQRRGSGKFGQGKEGTIASWTNGYGFGAWCAALVAAGFEEITEEELKECILGSHISVQTTSCVVIVEPAVWKRRMGAISHHEGEDSRGARKRANDLKTIEVAKRVDPNLDLLPHERGGGTKRADSPDKAAAFLIAVYGQRWILGGGKES